MEPPTVMCLNSGTTAPRPPLTLPHPLRFQRGHTRTLPGQKEREAVASICMLMLIAIEDCRRRTWIRGVRQQGFLTLNPEP
eukprot:3932663-Rhodomonas_salina.2